MVMVAGMGGRIQMLRQGAGIGRGNHALGQPHKGFLEVILFGPQHKTGTVQGIAFQGGKVRVADAHGEEVYFIPFQCLLQPPGIRLQLVIRRRAVGQQEDPGPPVIHADVLILLLAHLHGVQSGDDRLVQGSQTAGGQPGGLVIRRRTERHDGPDLGGKGNDAHIRAAIGLVILLQGLGKFLQAPVQFLHGLSGHGAGDVHQQDTGNVLFTVIHDFHRVSSIFLYNVYRFNASNAGNWNLSGS